MKSLIENPKPGMFKACCKKPRPVLLSDVPEDVLPLVDADVTTPGRIVSRYDRKLGNVVDLRCAFETTDRAAYAEHMKTVHGLNVTRELNRQRGHAAFSATRWKPPRLVEDGRPFVDTQDRTRTCPTCGMVDEITLDHAGDLWWREHREGCALASEQVAS